MYYTCMWCRYYAATLQLQAIARSSSMISDFLTVAVVLVCYPNALLLGIVE